MATREELNEEISREIEEEERRRKNKKILKILSFIFIPLFILFSISYVSLRYIGNIGIVVKEYPFYNIKITDDFHGVKVVQFSDIHFGEFTEKGKIDELIKLINNTNPDIVVFTGDLVDVNYAVNLTDQEYLISSFKKINASLGKYAIKGEEDSDSFDTIFNNSEFEILNNEVRKIYINDSYINLIAVDNNYGVYPTLLNNYDGSKFSIAITHFSDNSDNIVNTFAPDIILAGNSHNGQVRIPFIGPMMKRIGSKKYLDSYYKINDTELYISSGIGNTKYNMRLFNHPSINFFRLKKEASS